MRSQRLGSLGRKKSRLKNSEGDTAGTTWRFLGSPEHGEHHVGICRSVSDSVVTTSPKCKRVVSGQRRLSSSVQGSGGLVAAVLNL